MLDEGEVVLDKAHIIALAAAAEVSFSMNKVRYSAHHQYCERVANIRDLDIYWVQSVSKYGRHGPCFVLPHLAPQN